MPDFAGSLRDRLGVVGTIAAHARASLLTGNLVEQARYYRCIAGSVVGRFGGSDF